MKVQAIKDRWADCTKAVHEVKTPKRKRKAPNADGEPEQVLQFYAGMPAQKLLTSDAVFEPMQGRQPPVVQ